MLCSMHGTKNIAKISQNEYQNYRMNFHEILICYAWNQKKMQESAEMPQITFFYSPCMKIYVVMYYNIQYR